MAQPKDSIKAGPPSTTPTVEGHTTVPLTPTANGTTPHIPTTAPGCLPANFDFEAHRRRQDFDQLAGVTPTLTRIPVRKPKPKEFIRTHPDAAGYWYLAHLLLGGKNGQTYYLVDDKVFAALASHIGRYYVVPTYTRGGDVLLWPVRVPKEGEDWNDWWLSAHEQAVLAQTQWLRMQAKQSAQGYETYVATQLQDTPKWPDLSLNMLLSLAFKETYIDSPDHPEYRALYPH